MDAYVSTILRMGNTEINATVTAHFKYHYCQYHVDCSIKSLHSYKFSFQNIVSRIKYLLQDCMVARVC